MLIKCNVSKGYYVKLYFTFKPIKRSVSNATASIQKILNKSKNFKSSGLINVLNFIQCRGNTYVARGCGWGRRIVGQNWACVMIVVMLGGHWDATWKAFSNRRRNRGLQATCGLWFSLPRILRGKLLFTVIKLRSYEKGLLQ